ncbi:MAG: hypothetical protein V1932_04625 [Chloroflexota bacterium]
MAAKPRKKSPSRNRYEKGNPTVSARMPTNKRDKLFVVLVRLSLTLAQLLIRFADEMEIKTRPLEEVRKEGFQQARKIYRVYYPCQKCGRQILINTPEERAAASKYMVENGWSHQQCPEE